MQPSWKWERSLRAKGLRFVAGIDEVGRGPLAGPVAAAAVVLPPDLRTPWAKQIRDSKQLTAKSRTHLAPKIEGGALALGLGMSSEKEVDEYGIVHATKLAMTRAIEELDSPPDCLLIDAVSLPDVDLPQESIVNGDGLCISIAAASIVAKVARDSLMMKMEARYPGFGFAHNMGYGTPGHLDALERIGPCDIHRMTFAPVAEAAYRRRNGRYT